MSTNFEENLRIRVREELERLNLSQAEAARMMESGDYAGLRDVCNGRKRATAEFVYQLATTGADVAYILTGVRSGAAQTLSPREQALIDNYEHLSEEDKRNLERTASALAQQAVAVVPRPLARRVSNGRQAGKASIGGACFSLFLSILWLFIAGSYAAGMTLLGVTTGYYEFWWLALAATLALFYSWHWGFAKFVRDDRESIVAWRRCRRHADKDPVFN
jgi:hypothetical protein